MLKNRGIRKGSDVKRLCFIKRDDGRMTETCCGNKIRRGGELLRSRSITCLMNINMQQEAHHSNHNS
jgi:hypothetical protein